MKYFFIFISCFFLLGCSERGPTKILNLSDPLEETWVIEEKANFQLNEYLNQRESIKANLTPSDWEKLRWLSKAMVLLRGGEGIGSADNIQDYLPKSKEQIVDELVEDPRFFQTLLKFNYFYFGMTLNDVFDTKTQTLLAEATTMGPAFVSALNFKRNKNYFSLFESNLPFPVGESRQVTFFNEKGELVSGEEALRKIIEKEDSRIIELQNYLDTQETQIEKAKFCSWYGNTSINQIGLPIGSNYLFIPEGKLFQECLFFEIDNDEVFLDKKMILDRLEEYKKTIRNIIEYTIKRKDIKITKDLENIDLIDLDQLIPGAKTNYFSGLAFELTNSSTNKNRKRAAYVLDRFLCDNLIPVDIEVPENHGDGSHGSDPSCYACHYRLDPMAGFFKDYGAQFIDFSSIDKIIFDDNAQFIKKDYDKNWLNSADSKRKWNIGVIRSEVNESQNYYGENLEDLIQILQKMPEVKKCLTKRVFEYSVAPNQTVDQGYLNKVFEHFQELSVSDPNKSIQYLFKTFTLSQSFSQRDPQSNYCYDFPEGHNPSHALPCQVSYIIDKKCSTCHMPISGEKNLDMTSWVEFEKGKFGFNHSPDGFQLSLEESFNRLSKALTSSDPKVRMPLKKHMDPNDRQVLYLWINEQLKGLGK